MMGAGHAALGTAAWATTAHTLLPLAGVQPTPTILILGALPVAGASLIPDIDHPNASMANAGGPITKGISHAVKALSGGHRGATHTLWFFAATTALNFLTFTAIGMWGALTWFFLMTAFGAQALAKTGLHAKLNKQYKARTGIMAKTYCWGFAAVATVATYIYFPHNTSWFWLPVAITIGHASHLLGDIITTAGLDLGWGIPKIRIPILGDAGSGLETIFVSLCWGVAGFWILCAFIGADPLGTLREGLSIGNGLFHQPTNEGEGWKIK